MWISRKRWNELEKRVADLEKEVRDQPRRFAEEYARVIHHRLTAKSEHPYRTYQQKQQGEGEQDGKEPVCGND